MASCRQYTCGKQSSCRQYTFGKGEEDKQAPIMQAMHMWEGEINKLQQAILWVHGRGFIQAPPRVGWGESFM
jgi:hypothetical protein